jgi:hypothetical protein
VPVAVFGPDDGLPVSRDAGIPIAGRSSRAVDQRRLGVIARSGVDGEAPALVAYDLGAGDPDAIVWAPGESPIGRVVDGEVATAAGQVERTAILDLATHAPGCFDGSVFRDCPGAPEPHAGPPSRLLTNSTATFIRAWLALDAHTSGIHDTAAVRPEHDADGENDFDDLDDDNDGIPEPEECNADDDGDRLIYDFDPDGDCDGTLEGELPVKAAPIVDAGPDQTATAGKSAVLLDNTGSAYPRGNALSSAG